jgi:two-component system response regulator AtoC
VIVISAHGEVRDAVLAMKLGAYDYLVKPFDPDELLMRLQKAVTGRNAQSSLEAGRRKEGGSDLVGESHGMREVIKLVTRAAPSQATILVTGESGTGKEVVAKLIHSLSSRQGAFVPVNMGALPEQLMESELFGYEKGAFTGADSRKAGLFETAHGGTLFLDEIGEIPLHLQVKLLRAIQDRKVQRLGGLKGIPFDARIVAATNKNLEAEVREGRFREDLYYRINVIRVSLPPLRERRGDIPLLAGHFLDRISTEMGRKIHGMSPEALALLQDHDFPGNVRELENAIERAVILADGSILQTRDFVFFGGEARGAKHTGRGDEDGIPDRIRSLAELERDAIEKALKRNSFHRERTAEELGITRRTLLNKIHEYDLIVPER